MKRELTVGRLSFCFVKRKREYPLNLLGIVKEKPHGFYKKACCTRAFGEKKKRKLLFYGLFTREDLGFYKGLLR